MLAYTSENLANMAAAVKNLAEESETFARMYPVQELTEAEFYRGAIRLCDMAPHLRLVSDCILGCIEMPESMNHRIRIAGMFADKADYYGKRTGGAAATIASTYKRGLRALGFQA